MKIITSQIMLSILVILLFQVTDTSSKIMSMNFLLLKNGVSTMKETPIMLSKNRSTLISYDYFPCDLNYEDIYGYLHGLCHLINSKFINSTLLSISIYNGIYDNITYEEFHSLASETAAYMATDHPDYGKLASKLSILSLHKNCLTLNFSSTVSLLYDHVDRKTGDRTTNLSDKLYNKVMKFKDEIDRAIDNDRDFEFDYFGIKTLEKSYLMKIDGRVVETPQYMFMRVALGIHIEDDDLSAAFETYNLLSQKWFIHASPTLFQAGTAFPQLSSCFLLGIEADSIEGIYNTLHKCALISKTAGGIGLSVQNIRAKGSIIKGTKGVSNGLIPMLRVFDATARYVDQGGGKRPGAFAVYIEPWHADIFDVLELRKNTGKEEVRARDLFYGLWIPDLFMRRVESDEDWTLMCPAECPGLDSVWGEEFEELYRKYEKQTHRCRRVIRARELWYAILDAQMETGTPYMLYKDACNRKSNQQNLGTIKCSNLCTEIIEYTAPDEIAVCNLASLVLPKFVKCIPVASPESSVPEGSQNKVYYGIDLNGAKGSATGLANSSAMYVFDHDKLHEIVKIVTRNLNKIIDINYYPVPEARKSNMRHRPIGIGVQGLADVFQMMRLSFESDEARRLNHDIFETIYYAALECSTELAETNGPYESYAGSPASKGRLQFDLWEESQNTDSSSVDRPAYAKCWDWVKLKKKIAQTGLRNSLLVAPMPTASTAQILGFNECIEPYTSNIYARRVKAGEFIVVNPHLLRELVSRGLWTTEIKRRIIADGGSIQNIESISWDLKEIFKTVWEIRQKSMIEMAAVRGVYIDQSQSLNAFISQPDYGKLTSMHFHSWKRGLKTGMYYLRTKPAAKAIQFTVDHSYRKKSSPHVDPPTNEGAFSDDDGADDASDAGPTYGEVCTSCSG